MLTVVVRIMHDRSLTQVAYGHFYHQHRQGQHRYGCHSSRRETHDNQMNEIKIDNTILPNADTRAAAESNVSFLEMWRILAKFRPTEK